VVGALIIIGLTYALGCRDYNGAGMDIIRNAIEHGRAKPLAFFFKLVFTAITIGCGFKGGEVVPSFFIGATFGCVMGPLLGLSPGFSAAIGLICVFCGAVNCPIASLILSIELFCSTYLIFFAIACGISFTLSGYTGLYSSQKIVYSKIKAEFIDIYAK
jgi:H+/Cl- antiporter ClcA